MAKYYNQSGFTLVEMLIVLSLFMTIFVVTLPLNDDVYEKLEVRQFLDTLEMDILYMQNYTITYQSEVRLVFQPDNHSYHLIDTKRQVKLMERSYPRTIELNLNVFPTRFAFNLTGTLRTPGSFLVNTRAESYKVTFPFGKGRFYVTKQS
ncbi:competence type IV pilus minor pilin ComGD [Salinibacillus xinjiangensis]|uniref:Prepilin-type N-terminal cleavage/methylation domain-containing protein n=1 Tax=Salinibacillus xinjiangensis TaxID=1229268 RepID=A0A6G1X6K6_9BACI|nr:competence type IV pilus minor pilin ComGD [Salinibacillus xinjiangensis]MRG86577.1 prepilin-type N-terminal cleavage/methylation domain-containing protein [Salinibacillus xinjiangensis]